MTLNVLSAKIEGFFINFLAISGMRDRFQEQIAPKSIEINMDKLHMQFSALNVDFDGLSRDFLVLRRH